MVLTFVNNKVCPYGHRAWLVLLELGIPFEEKLATIKAGQKEAWFTEIYKRALGANEGSDGKVPVIEDDGFILAESAIIAEYLATKYGSSSGKDLSITAPQDKAFASVFLEHHVQQYTKAFYTLLREQNPDNQKAASDELLKAIRKISDALAARGGPYLLGERLTLPDLLFYPFVERLPVLQHLRNFSIPEDDASFAPFLRFRDALAARPAVKAAAQELDFFLEAYRPYAEGRSP